MNKDSMYVSSGSLGKEDVFVAHLEKSEEFCLWKTKFNAQLYKGGKYSVTVESFHSFNTFTFPQLK